MAVTQILDDRDPAVVYSSGWSRAGSSNEFNATTSHANDPGLTATLVFQGARDAPILRWLVLELYLGIQVYVYGTLGPRNVEQLSPQSSYSVDSSAPVTYQAVQSSECSVQQAVFRIPSPPKRSTYPGRDKSPRPPTPLFLDYFLILESR
jgi:hypothetical protein